MGIERLDHLNIRTARLEEMIAWYGDVLGMHPGPRPDFGFRGAWLYAGEFALVHLVEVEAEPGADPGDLKLEHGAFQATNMVGFIDKLKSVGQHFEIARISGFPIVQVNVWDPDGNHLHIDFHVDEADAAGV